MGLKLAIPLLGVLLWVMSMHAGSFATASILQGSPVISDPRSFFSTSKDNSLEQPSSEAIMKLLKRDRNSSVVFSQTNVDRLDRLETSLGWSDVHVQRGTPAHGQFIVNSPADEAMHQARHAVVAAKASQDLLRIHCSKMSSSNTRCAQYLSLLKMTGTPLEETCKSLIKICKPSDANSKYRSIDGSCNNVLKGNRGKSFTAYKRLLPPAYLDGIEQPRRSVSKKPMPSARLVSASLVKDLDRVDPDLSLAFMQWSQFVAHDLSHTASSKMLSTSHSVMCCDSSGRSLAPRYIHPFCMPIAIATNDPFYSRYETTCMSYARSLPALSSDCTFGPINQINQVTSYLDGSQIYGSTTEKASQLRESQGGRLLALKVLGREYLPLAAMPQNACQVASDDLCYRAGDVRVNMEPHLTAMHVFWLREHNRVAGALAKINRAWSDEVLYQEARRIVIAQIQHITYMHWAPVLLGKTFSTKLQNNVDYNDQVDGTVSNSFANAALRFMYTLVDSKLVMVEENRNASGSLRLQEHYNRPASIHRPGLLDSLVRGMATQSCQSMDLDVVSDVTQQLYRSGLSGFDAVSLDIQRGRDHGLPGYVQYRQFCGLPAVKDFDDLSDYISLETIKSLRAVYNSPADIDLLVGGMAEKPYHESRLGPTFTCLIGEQLYTTRVGDRYFHTRGQPTTSAFTADQLEEIGKASLARVFCDNGDDIRTMQPDVFSVVSERNNLVDCTDSSIKKMDLTAWKDGISAQ